LERRNQTTVIFSRRSLHTLERFVELLATGQVDFSKLLPAAEKE